MWYNKYGEREVIKMIIIFAIVSAIIGLGLIDYNQNHKTQHNILIGLGGYLFSVIIPLALIGWKYF